MYFHMPCGLMLCNSVRFSSRIYSWGIGQVKGHVSILEISTNGKDLGITKVSPNKE